MLDIIISGLVVLVPFMIVAVAGLRHRKRIRRQRSYGTVKKVYRGIYVIVWCVLFSQMLGWVWLYSPSGEDILVSLAFLMGACLLIALPCELYLFVCRLGESKQGG